ncbi:tRNA-U20a,U20b-dihydrouridine synthase [Oryzisolibacter propanilivorax]|uniref:tRNA-dihydrouridine(16) synthase n=1 Tax=Oryzisolibacter propanilivorax TaxID=1527607 RepID=A0A1G9U144_9BURK|nr:tRNA-dihydrouridine synthase [Oryzisolibacter propanilivorax]SDM53689.1 tRNA-U20a,U20b-dihydrouridine synthase [Oryzisolibacter propanilivorax]
MTLLLAPMEGLLDFVLRDVLTRVGGVDRCVSEFIRVTGSLLPDKVFHRFIPELQHGGRTLAGVPVRAQLLGSDPVSMAENAARLAQLGPEGIDLNFGCPAKTVNRHGGGASLLREPERIAAVVAAVRRAVPAHLPVSAKMRLGYDDPGRALECALAMQDGGACEVVVHARTKTDGYRPPAYWELVAPIRQALRVPVVANGEIWSVQNALRCRAASGCDALMLGRGIVADPGLALAIRAHDAGHAPEPLPWTAMAPHLARFWDLVCEHLEPRQRAGRLKQWLALLRRHYPQAEEAFQQVRRMTEQRDVSAWVARLQDTAACSAG